MENFTPHSGAPDDDVKLILAQRAEEGTTNHVLTGADIARIKLAVHKTLRAPNDLAQCYRNIARRGTLL